MVHPCTRGQSGHQLRRGPTVSPMGRTGSRAASWSPLSTVAEGRESSCRQFLGRAMAQRSSKDLGLPALRVVGSGPTCVRFVGRECSPTLDSWLCIGSQCSTDCSWALTKENLRGDSVHFGLSQLARVLVPAGDRRLRRALFSFLY